MEFWVIVFAVFAVNILCMTAMLAAQQIDETLPPRHSLIPGTNQKFLHIQDFWTMTWGDGACVPLIINGFVYLVMQDIANLWWGLPIMVVSALAFLKMCLGKNHKPDYGFPSVGKISFAGVLHLFYFGAGVGAFVVCVWGVITGDLTGVAFWVFVAGVVFYAGCFLVEIKSGNFDPLKRVEVLVSPHLMPHSKRKGILRHATNFVWEWIAITACFLTGRGEVLLMAWQWENERRLKETARES